MAKSPEEEHPQKSFGWAARESSGILSPFNFSRRENGDDDVTVKVLYCGVCHSDLHSIKNDWGFTMYPIVPGHEIVGVVTKAGEKVEKFKVGDRVGVGVIVGSCRTCESCQKDMENHCRKRIFTYGSIYHDGTKTYGGYSDMVIVDQRYVFRFPDNLPSDAGAPLLCAGITIYSPMKYYRMTEPGKHLGVVGLGGLGHVAVKFGKAFGLRVTVISTSREKEAEAIEKLGAFSFLVSTDPKEMKDLCSKRIFGMSTMASTTLGILH
ncbi:probable mannitol dehydrogenase isoform X2 [Cornus florida]|uniref:probable mannitol dehydrogenase isoform X2 n=1 Tax=Cornus florida TaxID=4283 RepID=UPI0028966D6E|nr:probable mannitol dehydrogenase isoform X2 [Cornus florida]